MDTFTLEYTFLSFGTYQLSWFLKRFCGLSSEFILWSVNSVSWRMKRAPNSVILGSRERDGACCDSFLVISVWGFVCVGEIRSCKLREATMYFNSVSGFLQTLKESLISCLEVSGQELKRVPNIFQENLFPIINNRKPSKQTFADKWNWSSCIDTETWEMKQCVIV